MASPSVSILNSYNAPGAKGSVVVRPGGSNEKDGCTFRTSIDLPGSPGLGNAYRSVMSKRASPRGNPKSGPEAWCDIYTLISSEARARVAQRKSPSVLPHRPAGEIPAPLAS